MNQRVTFFGLLKHRECLFPTWKGLLLIIIIVGGFVSLTMMRLQPFLSLTDPIQADILVVEGWVADDVLEEAMVEYKRGHYRKIYVTGGTIEYGSSMYTFNTYADLGTAILVKMGLSSSEVEAVPAPSVRRDRTYASALALKKKFHQQADKITGINLVSAGVHARRSQLLFQQAFGNELRVGIFSIEDRYNQGEKWWTYSDGVRGVTDELFAYFYALLVFPFIGI